MKFSKNQIAFLEGINAILFDNTPSHIDKEKRVELSEMILKLAETMYTPKFEEKETDSNEVKELVELLDEHIYGTKHKEDLADAILQAGYTKNKGEKVWEGFFDNNLTCLEIGNEIWEKFPEKNIQVFIREVE